MFLIWSLKIKDLFWRGEDLGVCFGNKLPLDCIESWTLKITKSFVFDSMAWQQGVFTAAELLLLLLPLLLFFVSGHLAYCGAQYFIWGWGF